MIALAVLWALARPAGQPTSSYLGQAIGAQSVLLCSIALVLISTLPWVEEWFDGIDRAAVWHRRVAIVGLVLILPHILLSSRPSQTAPGGTHTVRFTGKALGDYTSQLAELIQPGMPAVIGGPHGRFNYQRGTDRQIWVAAGVGVAPFLSWLRGLHVPLPHRVDFFYTAAGEPAFADEIRTIADQHDFLHAHLIDTSIEGRLTVDHILATASGERRGLTVFMCGPAAMLKSFQAQFRVAGVPRDGCTASTSTGVSPE